MSIAHEIPISNTDVEIVVKTDGRRLGRLKLSKGGIDWLPSPNSTSSKTMTWEAFATFVEEHGRAKKQSKPVRR